jgi:hypothetical protein
LHQRLFLVDDDCEVQASADVAAASWSQGDASKGVGVMFIQYDM